MTITIVGGLIVAVAEGLKMRHCSECSPLFLVFIQVAFLAAPLIISLVLIRDRPAVVTINSSSVDIQEIKILGFGRPKPSTTVNTSRFRYLTYKPVLGGAAVATSLSPFAIGGGSAIRLVLRGKPSVADVVFDLPSDVKAEPFAKDMPVLMDYLKRLGSALRLETRDEIWGRRLR